MSSRQRGGGVQELLVVRAMQGSDDGVVLVLREREPPRIAAACGVALGAAPPKGMVAAHEHAPLALVLVHQARAVVLGKLEPPAAEHPAAAPEPHAVALLGGAQALRSGGCMQQVECVRLGVSIARAHRDDWGMHIVFGGTAAAYILPWQTRPARMAA